MMLLEFINFITEEKNTHMTHLEDQVLYGGVDGTRQAINALRDVRDILAGHGKSQMSVKWDGAPAIFAGIDPRDGKFFVAKKGIFNKNPKVYKTDQDIDDDTSGDLNVKLKDALKYLPALGIKGVIQGDFLFGRGDLKKAKVKGKQYVTFHPNTIVYAVPWEQSDKIRSAKIGIVWHTTYKGSSFEKMKASYGVDVSKLNTSKNVWQHDAILRDASSITLTEKEGDELYAILSQCGKIFNQISGTALRELEAHPELPRLIEQFNNTFVRQGEVIGRPSAHAKKLVRWIKTKYQKEINARKTEKGKAGQQKKLNAVLSFFSDENMVALIRIFELQKLLVIAKLKLIKKFNSIGDIDTFVQTKQGYRVAGAEGYVAIDKLGKNAVKLVDRMEFSFNNFSPSILKGWQSSSRS